MAENRNVPAVRFQGFDGEWEQKYMGQVCEEYIERTVIQNQYPVLTSSQQMGIVFQTDYFANRQTTTDDNIGYYVLPRGFFTFRSRSDNDVFVFNRNDLIDKGIISYFYPVFQAKDTDSDFLLRRLNHGVKRQIIIASEGTGQHVLSLKKFKEIVALFPTIEEQTSIGSFFRNLDNLITLHQHKYDKLITVKKSMLDKMFPRDGQAVPEIRFAGFSGDWERRKLGDEVAFYSGLTYSPTSIVDSGGTLVLRSSNVKDGEIIDADNVFVSADVVNSDNVQVGDIIVVVRNGSRSLIGKHAQVKKPLLNTVIGAFMTGVRYGQPEFLNVLLSTSQFDQEIEINMGASINQITTGAFKEMQFYFPEADEQTAIGNYFRNMDALITAQSKQLDKLKTIKKSMLDKLFV